MKSARRLSPPTGLGTAATELREGLTHRGWGWLVAASAFGSGVYHRLYDLGLRRIHSVSVPVVSVGSLRMGGVGKTPLCVLLADRLAAQGRRVGIVSRGYRRKSRGVLVVSRGLGPQRPVQETGDEPWLLARRTSAVVVVGEDRRAAARQAIAEGADVIILDDGFQHRRLHRDLDVVVRDGAPGRSPLVLPFGSAREGDAALERTDLVAVVHNTAPESLREDGRLHVVVTPEPWRSLADQPCPRPRSAVLVSAIARPHRFRRTVEKQGVEVRSHLRLCDHHWLNAGDIARAEIEVRRSRADGIVTTEKDAVRWPFEDKSPVHVLPIRFEVLAGVGVLDGALARVLK